MIAIRHHTDPELSIEGLLENIAANIEMRKQVGDSVAKGAIIHKDHITAFDFLLSDGIEKPMSIIEHNTHWFFTTNKGIIHYQIASRHYTDAENPAANLEFIAALAERQDRNLAIAAAQTLPIPHGLEIQTTAQPAAEP